MPRAARGVFLSSAESDSARCKFIRGFEIHEIFLKIPPRLITKADELLFFNSWFTWITWSVTFPTHLNIIEMPLFGEKTANSKFVKLRACLTFEMRFIYSSMIFFIFAPDSKVCERQSFSKDFVQTPAFWLEAKSSKQQILKVFLRRSQTHKTPSS